MPVYRDENKELRLVLLRRVEGGAHGGQIAFPGGIRTSIDRTLMDTALREAEEEIGLARCRVEVLGPLPVVETRTTGFRISPFVARILAPPNWQVESREVAEVLDVRVDDLALPGTRGQETRDLPGHSGPQVVHFYRVGSHKLWGVTYRIVKPLIPRLLSGEWNV